MLALESVREQGADPCAWFLGEPKLYLGVLDIGVVKIHRQVIDPPAWCGALLTALCERRGDPHPSWRSSLVESGIKVSKNLM